jgi:hypothetical protein
MLMSLIPHIYQNLIWLTFSMLSFKWVKCYLALILALLISALLWWLILNIFHVFLTTRMSSFINKLSYALLYWGVLFTRIISFLIIHLWYLDTSVCTCMCACVPLQPVMFQFSQISLIVLSITDCTLVSVISWFMKFKVFNFPTKNTLT